MTTPNPKNDGPGGVGGPVLETARLLLRPMTAEDFDALLCIFTDAKVMAAFDSPPFDREQMQHWLQRNLDHQAQYGYGLFSVILKANGELIGNCGLENMEVEGVQAAELGYDFRSDTWHQGYATEAATAVRDFALHELGMTRLISLIRVTNEASRRVAERVGMRCAGEFERYGIRYWQYALDAESESAHDWPACPLLQARQRAFPEPV